MLKDFRDTTLDPWQSAGHPASRSARSRQAAAELLHHLSHLALAPHHLPHHAELLEQLVDLDDGRAAAAGDPLAPRAIDDFRAAALLR